MTTAAHTTPRALTAYLTRATWGLPEARRQELWDELEEHILTRADHLILSGLTPTQATAQAIHELGPPARVTLGMAKVYTMPKLILAATTLALTLSAGLYALAGGADPLTITLQSQLRLPTCDSTPSDRIPAGNVVSTSGRTTCYVSSQATPASQNGAPLISEENLLMISKIGGFEITFQKDGSAYLWNRTGKASYGFPVATVNQGTRYYRPTALIELDPEGRISGYDDPTLIINDHPIKFTSKTDQQFGPRFYSSLLSQFVMKLGFRGITLAVDQSKGPHTTTVATTLIPGEIVLAVTHGKGNHYLADYGVVNADQTVSFLTPTRTPKFVASMAQLQNITEPNAVLLARISNVPLNNLQSGIFVPAQATSDAR